MPESQSSSALTRPLYIVLAISVFLLCICVAISLGYFFGIKKTLIPSVPNPETQSPSSTLTPSPVSPAWLTAYESSNLPLQYPAGWHVYRQFILNRENAPITTYMDSQPIYYSDPNQGSVADIVITTSSGYKNPQGKFEEMLQEERTKNKNLKESTVTVNGLTVYKFDGSYVWEGNGTFKVLRYYTLFPSNDVLQRQIVSFELIDRGTGEFEKKSQILDHIIQTLKYK